MASLAKVQYAACLVLLRRGQVALQFRDTRPGVSSPGTLSAFGGRVEVGESAAEAAVRELAEELGVYTTPAALRFIGYLERFDADKRHFVEATYFAAELDVDPAELSSREGELFVTDLPSALADARLGNVTREMLHRLHLAEAPATRRLTVDQRLAAISTCLSYATYEANVYWQRNAIYLGINSILLGALAVTFDRWTPALLGSVGVIGLALNWYWPHVNVYSKYFAERWREDARALAKEVPELEQTFTALMGNPRLAAPDGPRPSSVMNQLSKAFKFLWVGFTIAAIAWTIVSAATSDAKPKLHPRPNESRVSPPATHSSATPTPTARTTNGR